MHPEAKNPVKSDVMLLDILEEVEKAEGAKLTKIANEVATTKSTVHNHLSTLRERGYVVKQDSKYFLSYQFLRLGEQSRYRTPLYEFARPMVDELSQDIELLANLCVEENGKTIYLYRTKANSELRFSTRAGETTHMHCVGVGKAILSQLSQERIKEIVSYHGLPSRTNNTITDSKSLHEEMERIRETGIAFDDEEYAEGLRCVAAPIAGVDESTLGAVSVCGPAADLTDEYFRETLPNKVQRVANVVELYMNQY